MLANIIYRKSNKEKIFSGDDSFNINVDYGTEAEIVALIESLVN